MTTFDPVSAAIGGALFGLAVTLLMLFNGRLAGVSGVAAALVVAAPGLLLARRVQKPVFAAMSHWPTKAAIDRPLLGGAALFGVGWGLSGLCPGPAIENLASLSPRVFAFVAAMGVGMIAVDYWQWRRALARPQPTPRFLSARMSIVPTATRRSPKPIATSHTAIPSGWPP